MTEKDSLPFHDVDFQRYKKPVNNFGELYTSAKHPDTFVRLYRDDINDDETEYLRLREIDADTLRLSKQLYDELTKEYGIETAKVNSALIPSTKSKSGRGVLIASNVITGEIYTSADLELGEFPESIVRPGKKLVSRLTRYLLDKYRSGDPYLYDIFRIDQYAAKDGKFVLFDVDPMIVDQAELEKMQQDKPGRTNYRDFMAETRLLGLTDMAKAFLDPDDFRQWQSDSRKALKTSTIA